MKQIRNLAISGVDTLEKANKVCGIVGDKLITTEQFSRMYLSDTWFLDEDGAFGFMGFDIISKAREEREDLIQMTYKEFLEKYDRPKHTCDNFDMSEDRENKHCKVCYPNDIKYIIQDKETSSEICGGSEESMEKIKEVNDKKDSLEVVPQCDGKFNGGYIKASQEAYDLLVEAGYKDINDAYKFIDGNKYHFSVANDSFVWEYVGRFAFFNIVDGKATIKQFYINNGALSWDEPIQISSMEDLDNLPLAGEEDIRDTYYEQLMQEEHEDKNTISIKNDNGKEQILKLQLQNQRLEKENKQLKNLCKNIQGAVELGMMKIDERTKVYEEYKDDK